MAVASLEHLIRLRQTHPKRPCRGICFLRTSLSVRFAEAVWLPEGSDPTDPGRACLSCSKHLGPGRLLVAPDRWDLVGAAICLLGVSVIMYAPRSH